MRPTTRCARNSPSPARVVGRRRSREKNSQSTSRAVANVKPPAGSSLSDAPRWWRTRSSPNTRAAAWGSTSTCCLVLCSAWAPSPTSCRACLPGAARPPASPRGRTLAFGPGAVGLLGTLGEVRSPGEEEPHLREHRVRPEPGGGEGVAHGRGLQPQHQLDQEKIEALGSKVRQLERSIALKDLALAEMEKVLQEMEAASYDGVFIWKITDFARKRQEAVAGRSPAIFSPAFYTSKYGYKMCLRIYLNGDGTGRGTHLSLFFVVMRGPNDALLRWPFNQKVTLMLLDQNNREHVIDAFRPDVTSTSFQRPVSDMNIASGCPLFCPIGKMESKNSYVRDDTIFIKAIVDLTGL
ncbi:hypothetical protein JRQ81_008597 [Phrynocephalus forsythii]|uniref:MATH domain-containing protein n=1 Tax=Phrynocephalus forsythii TaxID=171643 RepID=A0A9Q1ASL1_9SAUR|nr:hypothetical protein JRQ81_008597 [Phrynocephalus forsythii]